MPDVIFEEKTRMFVQTSYRAEIAGIPDRILRQLDFPEDAGISVKDKLIVVTSDNQQQGLSRAKTAIEAILKIEDIPSLVVALKQVHQSLMLVITVNKLIPAYVLGIRENPEGVNFDTTCQDPYGHEREGSWNITGLPEEILNSPAIEGVHRKDNTISYADTSPSSAMQKLVEVIKTIHTLNGKPFPRLQWALEQLQRQQGARSLKFEDNVTPDMLRALGLNNPENDKSNGGTVQPQTHSPKQDHLKVNSHN
jgi:hypothetical protein